MIRKATDNIETGILVGGRIFNTIRYADDMVYWHQRADERHGNLPKGNQELLVVRDKVGRLPDELGVSKTMECDIFPFSALTLLVGRQEGPVKNWMLVCWW